VYVAFNAVVADPLTVIRAPTHRYDVDPNVIVPAFEVTAIAVSVFAATLKTVCA
jgi:hypothetical protein